MADTQFLLVHGAWHGSWCWGGVSAALKDAGFETHTVDLPSHGKDTPTLGGLHDDATIIRVALSGLPGRTVVVAHSYGGVPVTEGAADATNVGHLVYLTSFMLDEGESVLGAAGGTPPPFWEATPDAQAWIARSPEDVFYNDCSERDTAWAVPQLRPQSASSFADTLRGAAWRDRPSTYVVCERDQAIPLFAQEAMSQRAGEVVRLDSGHSPFLSQPDELVKLLARFA
jgi:pimeloyl-ACP methyl ester carboxylesterase